MSNFYKQDPGILAKNPNTPLKTLVSLVGWRADGDDGDYPQIYVTKEVLNNSSMTVSCLEEILDRLIDSGWDELFWEFSKLPKLSDKMIEKLATKYGTDELLIDRPISQNSPIILDKLARHSRKSSVLIKIINNPITLDSTVTYLAATPDRTVRNAVINRPNVSQKALDIVLFMQGKPGTPVELLDELAEDDRLYIVRLLTKYPYTPRSTLEKIISSKYYNFWTQKYEYDYIIDYRDVANNLISHPNTSDEILKEILNKLHNTTLIGGRKIGDKDHRVRMIKKRLNGEYFIPESKTQKIKIPEERYSMENLYEPKPENEIPF